MPTASEISELMIKGFVADKASGVNTVLQFDLSGDDGGQFYLTIKDGAVTSSDGVSDDAKMTLKAAAADYFAVMSGEMNPMQAFMSGKLKISGDMGLAMKMQSMFKA